MLQYRAFRAFKVSCLLLMWTRFDCGSTAEATTVAGPEEIRPQEKPVGALDEELEGTGRLADATVRNFFPVKGKQKWMRREFPPVSEMLFFNVSVVGDDEEITLARLHLRRKRLAKSYPSHHEKYLPSPYRVVLYQVQPDRRLRSHEDAGTAKLASLPVSHLAKGGWQTLDVTAVVREVHINAQGPAELLLGVHFQAPKRPEKPYSPLVPLKHFLRSSGISSPEHPYGTSSRLVVFSVKDPYFEDLEENETPPTRNSIPTAPPVAPAKLSLKERHFKHKMSKGKSGGEDVDGASEFHLATNLVEGSRPADAKVFARGDKEKTLRKLAKAENEVLKGDLFRHGGRRRKEEVRRSKADELALKERTKLKSLPFLHANEVEEIRQTSRRLTRSSEPSAADAKPGDAQRQRRRKLINAGEVEDVGLKRRVPRQESRRRGVQKNEFWSDETRPVFSF